MTFQTNGYRVLIIEDDASEAEMLQRRLGRVGYDARTAPSSQTALDFMRGGEIDIVLLDVNLSGLSGFEILSRLRESPTAMFIPIIMVSALDDTESIVRAMQSGANDYITKPVNIPILLARMETQLKMASLLHNLDTQSKVLAKLAAYDDLTGIYNRRSLFDVLEAEVDRSRRQRHPLSLLMIDLDRFKQINDQLGHATGDRVLSDSAKRIRTSLRTMDVVGRYGGEEFCAILPETGPSNAIRTAERVRLAFCDSPFEATNGRLEVTVSIGAATMPLETGMNSALLLEQADQALYEAKNGGRNKVCMHGGAQV